MAQSVTLSSSGASASVVVLNPVFNETTMQLTVNSGSSGVTFVQYTLDPPTLTGTAAGAVAPTVSWAALGSAVSSAVDLTAGGAAGMTFTVLSPLCGLRLFGTNSSAGGSYNTTATLRVLQSITA
jgi:hypothetical protein